MALFAPIHLAYAIIIFMGISPGWEGSAQCSASVVYPDIMIANDCVFAGVYVLSLIFHWRGYFIKWDIVADEEAKQTVESFEKNEIQKLRKQIFS